MAAPTFQYSETNTVSVTVTDNVGAAGLQYAAIDSASIANEAINNPVTAGNNSYEKWWRMKVTGVASNSLSAFGVFFNYTTPPQDQGAVNVTHKVTTNVTYATPSTTAMAEAGTVNANTATATGSAITFTAPANSANAYSAYITTQMQTAGGATGGNVVYVNPWLTTQYTYSARKERERDEFGQIRPRASAAIARPHFPAL
jgi:hypothetical protein